ncbi:hypothetical protein [Halomontanus rarus]|uniref:hypothetical protein n=1 Tax=Halomontanus rarus TaxID=3034020 RepID=UPI00293B9F5C|nr:hypothetical protein [Halovivax sp. KZCA124]
MRNWLLTKSADVKWVSTKPTHRKRYAVCFPFNGMVKFTEGASDGELLAYCVAFGIVLGSVLGFFIGSFTSNSYIGPMGPAIGIFVGLAAWFILSDHTGL